MSENKWMTREEVANELEVSLQTVTNLIDRGDLQAAKVGRQWRIRPDILEAYLHRISTSEFTANLEMVSAHLSMDLIAKWKVRVAELVDEKMKGIAATERDEMIDDIFEDLIKHIAGIVT